MSASRYSPFCWTVWVLAPLTFFAALSQCIADAAEESADAIRIYVSTNGNLAYDGSRPTPAANSKAGPLPSVAAARDKIRQLRQNANNAQRPVFVEITGGVYELTQTLLLEKQDSGTPTAPVVYRAYHNELVRLIGGRRLPKPVLAQGATLSYDLQGILRPELSSKRDSRFGVSRENIAVYVDRQPLEPARWPNAGARYDPKPGWAYISGLTEGLANQFVATLLPDKFDVTEKFQIHVFPGPDWFDQYLDVTNINPQSREIALATKPRYPFEVGRRFYLTGGPSLLDAPGEWALDKRTSSLLLIPPRSAPREVVLAQLPTLFSLRNANYIEIEGLVLEMSTGDAVVIDTCSNVRIDRSVIGLTQGLGLRINQGQSITVDHSLIHDTGEGGLNVQGGNPATLSGSDILITNNEVTNVGLALKCYEPAIHISGVGIHLKKNYLHDGPHSAITLAGNNHLISGNRIERFCLEAGDAGAIYYGRNWAWRGNVIEGNIISDIPGWGASSRENRPHPEDYRTGLNAHGIYLDDVQEGSIIRNNILFHIGTAAIHLGGGGFNEITQNAINGCKIGLFISGRSSYSAQLATISQLTNPESIYVKTYPELANIEKRNPLIPQNIVFTGNIVIGVESAYTIGTLSQNNQINQNQFESYAKISANLSQPTHSTISDWGKWNESGFDKNSIRAPDLKKSYEELASKIESNAARSNSTEQQQLRQRAKTL